METATFEEVGNVFREIFSLNKSKHENMYIGDYDKYEAGKESVVIKVFINLDHEDMVPIYDNYSENVVLIEAYSWRPNDPAMKYLLERTDLFRPVKPIVVSGEDLTKHYVGWGPVPEEYL